MSIMKKQIGDLFVDYY